MPDRHSRRNLALHRRRVDAFSSWLGCTSGRLPGGSEMTDPFRSYNRDHLLLLYRSICRFRSCRSDSAFESDLHLSSRASQNKHRSLQSLTPIFFSMGCGFFCVEQGKLLEPVRNGSALLGSVLHCLRSRAKHSRLAGPGLGSSPLTDHDSG
jgi:hypothetical protein